MLYGTNKRGFTWGQLAVAFALVAVALLAIGQMTGCAATDGWLTQKTQTGEREVKVPVDADGDGVVDLDEDGKPKFEIMMVPIYERDWSEPVKFVADNIPGLAGVLASLGLTVGGYFMRKKHKNKEKNLQVAGAGVMMILKLVMKDFGTTIATLKEKADLNHDGKIDAEELMKVHEAAWETIKEKAEEYKAQMKNPAEWEWLLRHAREILANA